jgi:UDP-N-acetylglucosamine 2-epimerase
LRSLGTSTKTLTVVGARPQFIKAAAVLRALQAFNERRPPDRRLQDVLVHTGQHYDANMSALFFQELNIPPPAHHLGIGSGPHGQQTGRMLEALERVMAGERPDLVVVYGDTNSTLAGALAASKLRIPVAHVEAGLRSYNRAMPEETNRVIADHLSTLLFCPTTRAVKNLGCEGIDGGVHLVGDVMYDSLLYNLEQAYQHLGLLTGLGLRPGAYGLATVHRAETTDRPETLKGIFSALGRIGLPIVVPLHPRTRAALNEAGLNQPSGDVRLVPPVSYREMLMLARHARLILTDSGGVQKESFLLRVPCVTLRNETEWVETVEAGWNRLAGTEPDAVVTAARQSLDGIPPEPGRPYGDGHAAEAILEIVAGYREEMRA